jgi:haloalkane dehalogenase
MGKELSYVDEGKGNPIVFLHGNPASAYVWRNILPFLTIYGRCIAPDLIGMGRSHKIFPSGDKTYRFGDFQLYLDGLLTALGVTRKVTLVLHEWGSILGFDWARRRPEAIQGIAYMESIIKPLTWDAWPEETRETIRELRGPKGEGLALNDNTIVEKLLPSTIKRALSDSEMENYRSPFVHAGEGRRPTLSCIRDLPIDGEPQSTERIVEQYSAWLASTDVPKLFINCDPGYLLVGKQRETCRKFKNQTEITVSAVHYPQEDSPMKVTSGLIDWYQAL